MKEKVKSAKEAKILELEHYNINYSNDKYWKDFSLNYDINHRISYSSKFLEGKNLKILDVGCGGGGVSKGVSKKASKVVGIDISKEGIAYANKNKPKNTQFICLPIEEFISKNSEKFDAVLFFECLEHLYDGAGIVKKLTKAMKPGTVLVMSTPNYNRLVYKVIRGPVGNLFYLLTKNDRFKFKITHSHIKEFTIGEVKNILEKNNFRITSSTGRIIWTDPVLKSKNPTLLQRLNFYLGTLFPFVAGYMYITAVYQGKGKQ